jgi:hypothetical protein
MALGLECVDAALADSVVKRRGRFLRGSCCALDCDSRFPLLPGDMSDPSDVLSLREYRSSSMARIYASVF